MDCGCNRTLVWVGDVLGVVEVVVDVVENVCASGMRRKMFCCGVFDGKRRAPPKPENREAAQNCVRQGGRQAVQ